ncbi:MAG: c-type cytochrome biogenesis protein CcmI [Pseudomonadota bacterium]
MDALGFWIITGGLAALVALSMAVAFLRAGRSGLAPSESDVLLYKAQLAEIDRDVARGVLAEAEAEATRIEVKRRLLAADKAARDARVPRNGPRVVPGLVLIAAVLGGAFGLYATLGAPGYGDLPLAARIAASDAARATRPSQAEAEAAADLPQPDMSDLDPEFADLMQRLRGALAERPNDIEGFTLLAQNEARLGRIAQARAAQERVVALKRREASAEDWAELTELSVVAAGGYVSPEAEAAADAALVLDPALGRARYYKGLAEVQGGRPDLAFRRWDALLADSPADAPWVPLLRRELPALAELAGIPFRPEERPDFGENEEMIRNMVETLAGRLAAQGGNAEEWARLVHSLGVLGDHDRAGMIAAEALSVFAGDQEAVGMINAALDGSGERP